MNEYMLNCLFGVLFDFMVVVFLMFINIKVLVDIGLFLMLFIIIIVGVFVIYYYLSYIIKKIYFDYMI